MATRRPFWKWPRWKSIGFCLWPPSRCIWSLELKFQSKLDLHPGNLVTYRVQKPKNLLCRQVAILKMTLLKINRPLLIYISIGPLKFEVDIKAKVKLESGNQKIQYGRQAAKWHRWESIGYCLWPPSTCIWNLKLKFQSKLDLCSGNHVVYRQTDGRTDGQGVSSIPHPPSNFVGRGYKNI